MGESLLEAYAHRGPAQILAIKNWRASLIATLQDDPKGYIGRRFAALSRSVPLKFPDLSVLELYTNPLTSNRSAYSIDMYRFNAQPPVINYSELARICELRFSWGNRTGILNKFNHMVWPAVVLRAVIRDIVAKNGVAKSSFESQASQVRCMTWRVSLTSAR